MPEAYGVGDRVRVINPKLPAYGKIGTIFRVVFVFGQQPVLHVQLDAHDHLWTAVLFPREVKLLFRSAPQWKGEGVSRRSIGVAENGGRAKVYVA